MHKTRTYLLIEDRLGHDLAEHIETSRAAGASWYTIARDLYTRTQVPVAAQTLRVWFLDTPAADDPENSETVEGRAS